MKYRAFGRTGWQVSEIGFGAWQIGGQWGQVDDNESVATLLHAFASGINFIDTAELYGDGRSETVVGQALRQWSESKIYVATKIRPVKWPSPDDDHPQMRGRFPPWYIREAVHKALQRLGVERIDLFQLHSFTPDAVENLDWLETLNALRREGKIEHIGISLRDYRPDEGIDAVRFGLVDSVQTVFNLFEQRPAERLFAAGQKTKTAFIARVPLDSGSLSGTWTDSTYASWPPGSQQHTMFRGTRFVETLARVEKLNALCKPFYPSLAEAAVRYVLSESAVSTLIPGMRSRAEVDANVRFSDGAPFPFELKAQLPVHAWSRNYYT